MDKRIDHMAEDAMTALLAYPSLPLALPHGTLSN
jgi:hypothetical protein